MKNSVIRLLGALAACALLTVPARADIIFNNFGPGDSYQQFQGQSVGGTRFRQDVGDRFVPTAASYTLDKVVLPLSLISGTDGVDVLFMTSVGGVPGSVLESWHVSALPPFGLLNPPTVLDSVLHPLLTEGVPYYVVATVPAGDNTNLVWNNNSTGDHGPLAIRFNGGAWFVINDALGRGALRVEGDVVPEPSALVLLGLGTLGLLGYARRGHLGLDVQRLEPAY
jgi:hypothetical protein